MQLLDEHKVVFYCNNYKRDYNYSKTRQDIITNLNFLKKKIIKKGLMYLLSIHDPTTLDLTFYIFAFQFNIFTYF